MSFTVIKGKGNWTFLGFVLVFVFFVLTSYVRRYTLCVQSKKLPTIQIVTIKRHCSVDFLSSNQPPDHRWGIVLACVVKWWVNTTVVAKEGKYSCCSSTRAKLFPAALFLWKDSFFLLIPRRWCYVMVSDLAGKRFWDYQASLDCTI